MDVVDLKSRCPTTFRSALTTPTACNRVILGLTRFAKGVLQNSTGTGGIFCSDRSARGRGHGYLLACLPACLPACLSVCLIFIEASQFSSCRFSCPLRECVCCWACRLRSPWVSVGGFERVKPVQIMLLHTHLEYKPVVEILA